jgi:hypothetical protein
LKNNLIKQDHIEALYEERKEICDGCPFMKEKGSLLCTMPGTQPCCPECGCSLAVKLRSPDAACPKNFWGPVMTNQEVHLLNIHLNAENTKAGRNNDAPSDLSSI